MSKTLEREALDWLVVRKDHLLCSNCGEIMPIHPGDGTPASSFIKALEMQALRHRLCRVRQIARSRKS